MSKSAYSEEESSWAQTFFTVTPQDDGFLREIENTTIVSGNADVGLNLDSWNIVLRRPLADTTTTDFIDLTELEKPEFTATECQTYLQGVPKVDLPLVYRDEATQTLYMGKDEKAPFEKAFDDIIAVMNEKPLPVWKKSEQVQTKITIKNEASLKSIVEDLEAGGSGADHSEFDPTMISAAAIESADAMNFLVERALWMSEPVATSKIETKEAEIETTIKFNHASEKLTIDHEAQTDLSCAPKFSNSMLLSGSYGDVEARRDFERSIETDLETKVEREYSGRRSAESNSRAMNYDEVTDFGRHSVKANLEESADSNLPSPEKVRPTGLERENKARITLPSYRRSSTLGSGRTDDTPSFFVYPWAAANDGVERRNPWNEWSRRTVKRAAEPPAEKCWSAAGRQSSSLPGEPRKTEEILLTDEPCYVSRNLDEAAGNRYLNRACPSRIPFRNHPRSNNDLSVNGRISYEASSSSLRSESRHRTCRKYGDRELPASDEEALQSLKSTFCTNIIAD